MTVACSSARGEPAATENETEFVPDRTVTVACAIRSGLVLATSSVTPPEEAAFVSVAVHTAVAPALRVVGEQFSDEIPIGAAERVNVRVTPFMLAVSTAVLATGAALTIALKFALLAPDGTLTVAGTLTSGVPVSATEAFSLPMIRLTVRLQASWAPGFRVAGLHKSEVRLGGPSTDNTTILEFMPSVTVTFTFWSVVIAPTARAKVPPIVPAVSIKVGCVVTRGLSVVSPSIIEPAAGTAPVSAKLQATTLFDVCRVVLHDTD